QPLRRARPRKPPPPRPLLPRPLRPRRVYNIGELRLTCPNVDLYHKTEERAVIRALHLSPARFEEAIGESAHGLEQQFSRLQRYAFRSDLLGSLVDRLHQAAGERRGGDTLYTDSLINLVVLELWRLSGGGFEADSISRKGLSAALMRRIDRHIEDHCATKIDVAALADLADMPAALFQTAFRAATGRTPYQYVLARRVANARCMVESSTLSLAEIAFRTGFSSQSHMTDVFKAKLGVTPGGLRRAVP
ncbi:MAG: helix-turn-helix domain-containing protein, partial [Pseudomonadota bacterium]